MNTISSEATSIESGKFTVQFNKLNYANIIVETLILKYRDINGIGNTADSSDFRLRILMNSGLVVYVTLKDIQYEKNKKFKEDYWNFMDNWKGKIETETVDLLGLG